MEIKDGVRIPTPDESASLTATQAAEFSKRKTERLTDTIGKMRIEVAQIEGRRRGRVEELEATRDGLQRKDDQLVAEISDRQNRVILAQDMIVIHKTAIKGQEQVIAIESVNLDTCQTARGELSSVLMLACQAVARAGEPFDRKLEAMRHEIEKLERRRDKWQNREQAENILADESDSI